MSVQRSRAWTRGFAVHSAIETPSQASCVIAQCLDFSPLFGFQVTQIASQKQDVGKLRQRAEADV